MGQKVNPLSFRTNVTLGWQSAWCDEAAYAETLAKDLKVRQFLMQRLKRAGISSILIERPGRQPRVSVYSSRPGVVIGRRGEDIEKLRAALSKCVGGDIALNVEEVTGAERDARLIASNIAQQLEKRAPFKRAMKRAMQLAMKSGVQGIRVRCSGRLGGAEIARSEWIHEGRVPLHRLKARLDYGTAVAHTPYGTCGVKVWVYLGDVTHQKTLLASFMHQGGSRAQS